MNKAKRLLIVACSAAILALGAFGFAGCELLLAHSHDYGEGKVTTKATCTQAGVKTFTCECGDSYTEEIAALQHEIKKQAAQASTCVTPGWEAYEYCENCDYTTKGDLLPLAAHTEVPHEGQASTCSAQGWNAYVTCEHCDYTTKGDLLPLAAHTEVPHEGQASTCTAQGWNAYVTCENCDYTTKGELLPLEVHTFGDGLCGVCGGTDPDYTASIGLVFTLSTDETYYSVSKIGTCTDTDIVIPATYKNKPVKSVDNEAFNRSKLKSVVLPETLETIGKSAFKSCGNLLSVVIPDNVTSIGDEAFWNCYNLVHVTVGKKVSSIGYHAFEQCYKLLEVCNKSSLDVTPLSVASYAKRIYTPTDGKSYLSMDENGFIFYTDGAEKIFVAYSGEETSLSIPDGTTGIYSYAFVYNIQVRKLEIPDTITSVGYNAFNGCDKLEKRYEGNSFYLGSANNPYVALIDSSDYNEPTVNANTKVIADYAFYGCDALTKLDIPNGVVSIGHGAFYDCTKMASVTIPDSVTWIGEGAFCHCYSLEKVVIPDGVTSLQDMTFTDCKALKEVTMGENVTSIGDLAFYDCYSLTSITIPDSVKTIGDHAFYSCSAMKEVRIGTGVESIGFQAFNFCNALKGVYITDVAAWCNISHTNPNSNPLYYAKKLYVNGELVQDLVIPDGVTQISKYAFYTCENLMTLVIPDTVETIKMNAFQDCFNLVKVELGSKVSRIDSDAFNGDWSLVEVYNKPNLSLEKGTGLDGSIALYAKNIYTPTEGESKLSTDSNGYIIYTDGENKSLVGYKGTEKDLVLPNGITEIFTTAFYNNINVTSVVIPDSVTTIGQRAFAYCKNLMRIEVGAGLVTVGFSAFSACDKLFEIYNKSSLVFQPGTGYNGEIARVAKNIYTPTEGESKLSTDANGYVIYTDGENKILVGYKGMATHLVLPEEITEICEYVFAGCDNVESVTLPKSVTAIGNYAFYDCISIKNVYYAGSESDWANVTIGSNNNYFKNATRHYGA